jgi:2,5-diketo-D-gluconate reductase A
MKITPSDGILLPRTEVLIPQIGFGLFLVEPDDTVRVVDDALAVGYRHFDTASAYNNEQQLGIALSHSGLARSDYFVTTKLWNDDHGAHKAADAIDRSLELLGLSYTDLFLIHWPAPQRGLFVETWAALVAAQQAGKTRAIGVSNFLPEHIDQLTKAGLPTPSVDQIELHPAFQQREIRAELTAADIRVESWAPMGHGAYDLRELEPLMRIALAHEKSVHQVALRWHLQEGLIVIPKSTQKRRMQENFDITDFELNGTEMEAIHELDEQRRIGTDPREKN